MKNDDVDKQKVEKFKLATSVVTKQGNRILQLQRLKTEAISNEDYLTAKKIKDLMSKIEEQISTIDSSTGDMPDEINPQVLVLRHQQLFSQPIRKTQPKSAEQIFEENQKSVNTSA